jgi:hypothetical protein
MALEESQNLSAAWRTIKPGAGNIGGSLVQGSYFLTTGSMSTLISSGSPPSQSLLDLNLADLAVVPGRKVQLRMRLLHAANDVAPTYTITVDLRKITAYSGSGGSLNLTLGAAITGSAVAFVAPAADVVVKTDGAAFDLPADGQYILVATTSVANQAANSACIVLAELQARAI